MKINRYFDCLESLNPELVYDLQDNIWKNINMCKNPCSPFSPDNGIKTYKAAIRHIRKHNEIPEGTKFKVLSMYVGLDRYITK